MTAQPDNRFFLCRGRRVCCKFKPGLRLLFVLATEHTLLRKFINILRQILFPGNLDDDALLNFCTIKP